MVLGFDIVKKNKPKTSYLSSIKYKCRANY